MQTTIPRIGRILVMLAVALGSTGPLVSGTLELWEPYGLEGPGVPPDADAEYGPLPLGPGAVLLPQIPADYAWWNGCSPTAAGMLFGWWEEHGYDAFPGDHRSLPATFSGTSTDPTHYQDARGVVASWAHKQAGMAQSLTYGSYQNHTPDSLADFMLTRDGGTSRSDMAHGFKTFGAWDDPRTPEIESRRFTTNTVYTPTLTFDGYCAEIDAGRPVHIGVTGHSMLGIGYNRTDGKQNLVVHTTWHSGVKEWSWTDASMPVYGATFMNAVADPTPELSAYLSVAHTNIGDLTAVLGVGDPANPTWSTTAWNRGGGSADNLVLTDIDCTPVLSSFLTQDLDWFLKVTDSATGNLGSIVDFQIRYRFDELVFRYLGAPLAILDHQSTLAYLTTQSQTQGIPEPSTWVLAVLGGMGLVFWRQPGSLLKKGREIGNDRSSFRDSAC